MAEQSRYYSASIFYREDERGYEYGFPGLYVNRLPPEWQENKGSQF